jgi:hypothetical protein
MNETIAHAKEPYEEPSIEDVPLQSDDMMVGNCKGDGHTTGRGGSTSCHITPTTPCKSS